MTIDIKMSKFGFLKSFMLLFLIAGHFVDAGDNIAVVITRIGNCPGDDKLPINIPDFKITQVRKGEYMLNGLIEFGLNVTQSSDFVGEIDVLKCQDVRNDQKCVSFMSEVNENNVCRLLQDDNAIYSPFMMSMQPRITCPIREGVYKVVDRPVTDNLAKTIPILLNTTYMLIRVRLYLDKKKVMCAYTRLHFTRKRGRKQ